jgi:type 1 glutamine amidotransferase
MTIISRHLLGIALLLSIVTPAFLCIKAQSAGSSSNQGVQPGGIADVQGRQVGRRPGRKNVLAWIDSRSAMQSHGAAIVERLGYESGLYDTFIRSDSQSAIRPVMHGNDSQRAEGYDLDQFDAIFFLGSRESDLTPQQRADLISFVKDDGKGFVGGHAAADSFRPWAEYGEMVGGTLAAHTWGFTDETLVIEDPNFPGMQTLPRIVTRYDETYEMKNMSRDKVDVLMRLDASKLDMSKAHRKDDDFPLAWAKTYGKGRVYCNTLGHDITVWDNPTIQKMYFEAMKWALGLTDAKIEPHPLVRISGTPQPLK